MAVECATAAGSPVPPCASPAAPVDREVLERHLRLLLDNPLEVNDSLTRADCDGIRLAAMHLLTRLDRGAFDRFTACDCRPIWREDAETIARVLANRPGGGAVAENEHGIWVYVPKARS
jgi:hypothetical protein